MQAALQEAEASGSLQPPCCTAFSTLCLDTHRNIAPLHCEGETFAGHAGAGGRPGCAGRRLLAARLAQQLGAQLPLKALPEAPAAPLEDPALMPYLETPPQRGEMNPTY